MQRYPTPVCNSFEDAVKQAASHSQWRIIGTQPGKITCLLMVREHSLVVNVIYDDKFFYIDYERSTNMNYHSSRDLIDRHYAKWTRKLAKNIQIYAAKQSSTPAKEDSSDIQKQEDEK